MKRGQKVTIYQDPITRQRPEGKAKLIGRVSEIGVYEGHPVVRWQVEFADEPGVSYERTVVETDAYL